MVFTFGRFTIPTVGHKKLIDKVKSVANQVHSDWRIYASHSRDNKKNPIDYVKKIKYLKLAFPAEASHIYVDSKDDIKTPYDVFYQLSDEGYDQVIMVVGSDRVDDFKSSWITFLRKPENKESVKNIKSMQFVSAGQRDPDASGVEGMSASKLRDLAIMGKLKEFTAGLPDPLKPHSKEVYHETRRGLGLKESRLYTFKRFTWLFIR